MVVFVVKWYAVCEAKEWRYMVCKAKIGWNAVKKGGEGVTLINTVYMNLAKILSNI